MFDKLNLVGRAYFLSDYIDRLYFSEIPLKEGYLLISESEKICFLDARYYSAFDKAFLKNGITPVLIDSFGEVGKRIKSLKAKTLLINFDKVSVKDFEIYKKFGKEIKDCSEELVSLRSKKTEEEIENIKTACAITQKAFYETLKIIKKGVSEREVKEYLNKKYIEYGAESESFDTIVAFGENSAIPHHDTGSDTLKENSVILIDTGCVYHGYCSDYTRTVYFGTPDEQFIKDYNLVKEANERSIKNISQNTSGKSADAIARNLFREYNVDNFFTHSLGHGVGLEIHESPRLGRNSKDVLSTFNVFTIEPGIYRDNEYGIRIEDTVVMEKDGVKRLFTDGKELLIIK